MAQAAPSNCEICIDGPGEHYCQQCDQLFCGGCKKSHLRYTISKHHTFCSEQNINPEEKLLCTKHEEGFLFYCKECDTLVCRICSVEKHCGHLLTDLTKSTLTLKSELVKNIESKIGTSNLNLNKLQSDTKAYREEVKAVIKMITEEGNNLKKLIDKKVESLVKLVQDGEQKALQSISAVTEVYLRVDKHCQQWEKNVKEMETIADELLLQKLQKLKIDVDDTDLKQVPERFSVSYKNKKLSVSEIDSLFGELQFR